MDGVPLGRHVASQKASGTVLDHHVGVLANITGIELAQKLTSVEAAMGLVIASCGWGCAARTCCRSRSRIRRTSPHSWGPCDRQLTSPAPAGACACHPMHASAGMRSTCGRPTRSGLIAALTGRAEPSVARLAMAYALLDRSREVTAEHRSRRGCLGMTQSARPSTCSATPPAIATRTPCCACWASKARSSSAGCTAGARSANGCGPGGRRIDAGATRQGLVGRGGPYRATSTRDRAGFLTVLTADMFTPPKTLHSLTSLYRLAP